MCRLFGFRSTIPSQVHSSLISAENALSVQAHKHPDGWGVAYYLAGAPHLIKSSVAAYEDRLFDRVSGVVSSETVVAHIRRATVGETSVINSHPFQYGRWVFAHNGEIEEFESVREEVRQEVAPILRRFILGDTDSEVIFYLLLTYLARRVELHRVGIDIDDVADAVKETLNTIRELCVKRELPSPLLTVLITNGTLLVASRFGRELYRSTYKKRCPERDTCPSLAYECEHPAKSGGAVSHFILSSEPLQGHNVWDELNDGQIVGCDWRMHVHDWQC
jgi:predicted glutamine amidotransferase